MAKGVMFPHCGNRYEANAGGVGTHEPGPVFAGAGITKSALSLPRQATIWSATDSPHVIPLSLCGPFGIRDSEVRRKSSNVSVRSGNKATSARCAAATAAASVDALVGPALLTKNG